MREGATNGSDKSHAEGVFDWTQSGQSGAWGDPNQRFRNIQKDIPKTLLAYVSGAFGSLPPAFPCKVRSMPCTMQIMALYYCKVLVK